MCSFSSALSCAARKQALTKCASATFWRLVRDRTKKSERVKCKMAEESNSGQEAKAEKSHGALFGAGDDASFRREAATA